MREIWVGRKEQNLMTSSVKHHTTVVKFCCFVASPVKGYTFKGKKACFSDRMTREILIWIAGDLSDTNDTCIQRLDLKTFGAVTPLICYAIMPFFCFRFILSTEKNHLCVCRCISQVFCGACRKTLQAGNQRPFRPCGNSDKILLLYSSPPRSLFSVFLGTMGQKVKAGSQTKACAPLPSSSGTPRSSVRTPGRTVHNGIPHSDTGESGWWEGSMSSPR